MRVRVTAQACMAEVAIRVVRLLQRAKHKRCIRLAAVAATLGLPGDQPARFPCELARLLGVIDSGSAGVGISRAASCSIIRRILSGSGCSWTR